MLAFSLADRWGVPVSLALEMTADEATYWVAFARLKDKK